VPAASIAKLLFIMTLAATTSSLLFNFSTSSNFELLSDRFVAISKDPAQIGLLLGVVYAVASLAQLVVGRMIDKYPLKPVYLWIVAAQALCLALATQLSGWAFYAIQFVFMATIFGAVPFTDAMLVRFVDDTIRSRVAGMRLAVSIGASSLAIFLIGPLVKQAGFTALLWVMAVTSVATFAVILNLPSMKRS
jgi:MFS family permease